LDRGVVQAGAQTPAGVQLVNPAGGTTVDIGDDGPQQAVYFEASDLPAELPTVLPAN
jgi:hypothetical protein